MKKTLLVVALGGAFLFGGQTAFCAHYLTVINKSNYPVTMGVKYPHVAFHYTHGSAYLAPHTGWNSMVWMDANYMKFTWGTCVGIKTFKKWSFNSSCNDDGLGFREDSSNTYTIILPTYFNPNH